VTEGVKRSSWGLLRDPTFGGLFAGKLCSVAGVYVHTVVAAVLVYQTTRSATAVALVGVVQYGPQLLLAPLSGALTDRGHVRSQLILGRLLCTIGSGSLAVWVTTQGVDEGWTTTSAILVASLVVGLGFVVGGPAQQSVVPQLVTPEELPAAMVLNTGPTIVGRNAGPVLGAVVLAAFGPAWAFAAAAASHLVLTAIFVLITIPPSMSVTDGAGYAFRHALRYVGEQPAILLMLVASTASAVGSEPTITLTPAVAVDRGGGAHLITLLTLAFGIGATGGFMTTSIVARRTTQGATVSGGLVLMAAGSLLAAVGQPAGVILVAFGAIGCGFGWTMTAASTLIQQRTPPHLRGRIMAMWLVGFVGARPVSSAAVGALADLGSVALAFIALSVILAGAAVLCSPARVQQHVADPAPTP
jgi:MFS family permease